MAMSVRVVSMGAVFTALVAVTVAETTQLPCEFHNRLAAGNGQTCALTANTDAVTCWGDVLRTKPCLNVAGAQTRATNTDGTTILEAHGQWETGNAVDPQYHAVSVGVSHACALTVEQEVAAPIPGYFKAISSSRWWNCAIYDATSSTSEAQIDTITCWGDNTNVPEIGTDVPAGKYFSISVGRQWACAIEKDTKRLACWGECITVAGSAAPVCPYVVVPGTAEDPVRVAQVSVGRDFACYVDATSRAVKCFAADPNHGVYQLSITGTVAVDVAAGSDFVCVIGDSPRKVLCDSWNPSRFPVTGNVPNTDAKDVTAGADHACIVTSSDTIECWGDDKQRQTEVPAGLTTCPAGKVDWVPLAQRTAEVAKRQWAGGAVALLTIFCTLFFSVLSAAGTAFFIKRRCGIDFSGTTAEAERGPGRSLRHNRLDDEAHAGPAPMQMDDDDDHNL